MNNLFEMPEKGSQDIEEQLQGLEECEEWYDNFRCNCGRTVYREKSDEPKQCSVCLTNNEFYTLTE